MHHLLGQFKIDLDTWKRAIEQDKSAHAAAGLRLKQVWRNADDPTEIYFMFELDDLETGRDFLQRAGALDAEKQASGEIPKLVFLSSS